MFHVVGDDGVAVTARNRPDEHVLQTTWTPRPFEMREQITSEERFPRPQSENLHAGEDLLPDVLPKRLPIHPQTRPVAQLHDADRRGKQRFRGSLTKLLEKSFVGAPFDQLAQGARIEHVHGWVRSEGDVVADTRHGSR